MAGISGQQFQDALGGQRWLAGQSGPMMGQQYGQMQQAQGQVSPFWSQRLWSGLPFYRQMTDYNQGTTAAAFAPQRAAFLRTIGGMMNMPSGYRQAVLNNINSQQARAFDSNLTQAMMANEMAKQQGAAGLMGQEQVAGNQALGYGGLINSVNQGIMGAPQKPTAAGMLGGLASAGLTAAAAF